LDGRRGKVADAFNDVVEQNAAMAEELARSAWSSARKAS
jgi:hypothetical protein